MDLTDQLLNFNWAGVSQTTQDKVEKLFCGLRLTDQQIKTLMDVFLNEMELGLSKEGVGKTSLMMENTFLPELPNGHETGEFLALDLGGTNFRVMYLHLEDGQFVHQDSQTFGIDEATRLGPGTALFDHLASCIHDFLLPRGLLSHHMDLGFTFSFPMTQRSLNVGILKTWTKSFKASGCVGEDAVRLLNDALRRRGDVDVNVVAILNDTTGTLVQGAALDHQCAIGVIVGTGCNGAYIEQVNRVLKWDEEHNGIKEVVIDIEWGAFGDNGVLDFVRTDVDRAVDSVSLLVNSFTFEKYIAGKYLGEVARQCVLKAHRAGLLFPELSRRTEQVGSVTTKHVSMIEKDTIEGSTHHLEAVMSELGQRHTAEDLVVLRYICALISVRAAILVSSCLAVLLERCGRQDCGIAADGTVFRLHPRLSSLMERAISHLAPSRKFHMFLAEDGSGKGAALVAAVAKRLKRSH